MRSELEGRVVNLIESKVQADLNDLRVFSTQSRGITVLMEFCDNVSFGDLKTLTQTLGSEDVAIESTYEYGRPLARLEGKIISLVKIKVKNCSGPLFSL